MFIRAIALVLLIPLVGALWFGYNRGLFDNWREWGPFVLVATRQAPLPLTEIEVLHQYKAGAHAYYGKILLPSACHSLDAQSVVRESYPEDVVVYLNITIPEDISACAGGAVQKTFKVAFESSPEALISVILDGKPATFVVTEASSETNVEALPVE